LISIIAFLFFLFLSWLPLEEGCIHETSRFTSVSLSGAVGRTPWTSDQLIARLLPTQYNTNIE
jgi:hypothetical protein